MVEWGIIVVTSLDEALVIDDRLDMWLLATIIYIQFLLWL